MYLICVGACFTCMDLFSLAQRRMSVLVITLVASTDYVWGQSVFALTTTSESTVITVSKQV